MGLRNTLTVNHILNTSYDSLSKSFGIIVILLVILIVMIRIILEAGQSDETSKRINHFDVLAAPLLCALAIVIVNRLIDLFPR